MDSGNIGFVLLCAAFVFVMTPGLAMFYGGLVRKKNVVNTIFLRFHSFFINDLKIINLYYIIYLLFY